MNRRQWVGVAVVVTAFSPLIDAGELGGRVVDFDGDPQYGMTVVACSNDGDTCTSAMTDEAGDFCLTLDAGAYEITLDTFGFEIEPKSITLAGGVATHPDLVMRAAGVYAGIDVPHHPPMRLDDDSQSSLTFSFSGDQIYFW